MKALRFLAAFFAAPTFTRRRCWAGSIVLTCHQTAEEYRIIPAGMAGFYVSGSGGRYIAQAPNHCHAIELIERDARDAVRALARLAAA
jgi:hypothetical protein